MIKTQIQMPDDLYKKIKHLARQKEWSLAETLRRASEQFLERHPHPAAKSTPWHLPTPCDLGWRGLTHAQIRAAALADMEPRWPEDQSL